MDLLNAQFNSGPLSLEEIKTILGNDFAAWGVLSKKFNAVQTSDGEKFCNERLELERLKRKAFVESRKNNLKGKGAHMGPHMEPQVGSHMENANVNENRNINLGLGGVGGKGKQKPKNQADWMPIDFVVTDEMFAWAAELGVPSESIQAETEHWADYHAAKGSKFKNWTASWRTWMRNSIKFKKNLASSAKKPDWKEKFKSLRIGDYDDDGK